MQSNIALHDNATGLVFGSVHHIQDDLLSVDAVFPWRPHQPVSFRLELTERNAWVTGQIVLVADVADKDGRARCRIVDMPREERQLLDDWLGELSSGGTSEHPERWVDTLSQISTVSEGRKRSLFSDALRARVRKTRAARKQRP